MYQDGATFQEIANLYNYSRPGISRRLKEYCEKNNLPFASRVIKVSEKLPIQEIYEKYQNGISLKDMTQLYDCSQSTLYSNLRQYCEKNNLPFQRQKCTSSKTKLSDQKIYTLYQSGMTIDDIANQYNYSSSITYDTLYQYCKKKHLPFQKLPIREVYELYQKGTTIKDIANQYNFPDYMIYDILYQYCQRERLPLNGQIIGRLKTTIPLDKIYEMYQNKTPMIEIANIYNCSCSTISKKIHQYCNERNIPFTPNPPIKEEPALPMDEIYKLFQKGTPLNKIATLYDSTSSILYNELCIYCKNNNLPYQKEKSQDSKKTLPFNKLYKMYCNGTPIKEMAELYHYPFSTLYQQLKQYCTKNNLSFPRHNTIPIKLPMDKIYKMYQEKFTFKQIARKYDVSPSTVYRNLFYYSMENNLEFANFYPGQEEENLHSSTAKIYSLYQSGVSVPKIAKCLHLTLDDVRNILRNYAKEKENSKEDNTSSDEISFKKIKQDKRIELLIQLKGLLKLSEEISSTQTKTIKETFTVNVKKIGTIK